MQGPKRRQYKYAKSRYRVKNWAAYEAGLRRRGDLTVWLSDEALNAWQAPPSGKPGGQRRFSDIAIEAALTIRMVFHLPLRQTEGFLHSLMQLLDVDLPIPDHTTLSRRLQTLGAIGFHTPATHGPLHLLIDSTGLRILLTKWFTGCVTANEPWPIWVLSQPQIAEQGNSVEFNLEFLSTHRCFIHQSAFGLGQDGHAVNECSIC